MRIKTKTMALRPYLESLLGHCNEKSKQELLQIISALAQDVPSHGRAAFLEKIATLCRGETGTAINEDLLHQIRDLKKDVIERSKSIEDGSYYDDHEAWDEHGRDEDPETLSEEQKAEIESCFQEAGGLFVAGKIESARKVYEALFEFFSGSPVDDASTGLAHWAVDIDFREEMARYCRCVYEACSGCDRVGEMVGAMRVDFSMSSYRFDIAGGDYPMLRDVVDARPGEMPDWKDFLVEWKSTLMGKKADRARVLLLEAVWELEGVTGVASLARAWKASQPRGYLFWINILESRKDWPLVAAVAGEALDAIPSGELRAQAARSLAMAGKSLGDEKLALKGRREEFFSTPDENKLFSLLKGAGATGERAAEIEKVLQYLSEKPAKEKKDLQGLHVKALLMAGKVEEAFSMAKNSECVGWSYGGSAGGVLFGGVLAALTVHRLDEAEIIRRLLRRYTEKERMGFAPSTVDDREEDAEEGWEDDAEMEEDDKEWDDEDELDKDAVVDKEPEKKGGGEGSISDEIIRGLREASIPPDRRKEFMAWAERMGRKRIEHIVSNKHRRAYGRAAEALAALAECFVLSGNEKRGRGVIDEYRNQKYNRYPAFRREIDSAARSSGALKAFL